MASTQEQELAARIAAAIAKKLAGELSLHARARIEGSGDSTFTATVKFKPKTDHVEVDISYKQNVPVLGDQVKATTRAGQLVLFEGEPIEPDPVRPAPQESPPARPAPTQRRNPIAPGSMPGGDEPWPGGVPRGGRRRDGHTTMNERAREARESR